MERVLDHPQQQQSRLHARICCCCCLAYVISSSAAYANRSGAYFFFFCARKVMGRAWQYLTLTSVCCRDSVGWISVFVLSALLVSVAYGRFVILRSVFSRVRFFPLTWKMNWWRKNENAGRKKRGLRRNSDPWRKREESQVLVRRRITTWYEQGR